MMWLDVKTL